MLGTGPLRTLNSCFPEKQTSNFYSASALLAMQSAVLARGILSVRLSVRHVPVLCPEE